MGFEHILVFSDNVVIWLVIWACARIDSTRSHFVLHIIALEVCINIPMYKFV